MHRYLEGLKARHPEKFAPESEIFRAIRRGNSIFIGSSCAEPQYLLKSLVRHVENSSTDIFGAEVIHVWALGVAPYADKRFERHFRHKSFFISDSSRQTINSGLGDYTPIFLSEIPGLFKRGIITIDVALIQVSLPYTDNWVSLGVSVDIVKAAVENARLVIAQVNSRMPCVYGDSMVHADRLDFILQHDEELLEYDPGPTDEVSERIGGYIARIVQDGDTIQVGYGSMPNAILASLREKHDLGVHTELLTDGVIDLMRRGVVTNAKKHHDRGRTVAAFCMGSRDTYDFLHENSAFEFRPIDYTNNPFVIATQGNITAINSALQIDLTGQSTAESIGMQHYSGVGGQADFMRGASLSPRGKSVLALRSTSNDGKHSRIVPRLDGGASTTLVRGDVHYVVTEHGIAHLHAKNLRERAMSLIAIAAPEFRPWLIEEAKRMGLIHREQAFIPGKAGEYPGHLEAYKTTPGGFTIFLRPVKIADETLIRNFFYALLDKGMYARFFANMDYIPRETIQDWFIIDYTRELVMLATITADSVESILGMCRYVVDSRSHTAAVSFAVRDDFQNRGIGTLLAAYLKNIALKEGLLGFTATVLFENKVMLHLFDRMGFTITSSAGGIHRLDLMFDRDRDPIIG
ncbi:MAG: GNAT family N-acetyltransferase [Spirochaetes bacterium]|nr:MAG: GNAT family N-acetyltransferase [Spirochaetota bacterium]